MTTPRPDFTSNDHWPPKVDYDLKKLRYDTALDALEIVHPKRKGQDRIDVAHVTGFLMNGRVRGILDRVDPAIDIREQGLHILRLLEGAGFVKNTGGDWSLTAAGAIWYLVAENNPSGWAEYEALVRDTRLQWWSLAEINAAWDNRFFLRRGSVGGPQPGSVFDLWAINQPLDGWNGWH